MENQPHNATGDFTDKDQAEQKYQQLWLNKFKTNSEPYLKPKPFPFVQVVISVLAIISLVAVIYKNSVL